MQTTAGQAMNSNGMAKRRFGCLQVFLFVLAAVVAIVIVCFFAFRAYLFPKPFRPVTLTAREETALQTKLERLNVKVPHSLQSTDKSATLEPEVYSETATARKIQFAEKELNALLAKNTDLADKVAIDLSPGLVSARILVPIDPDVPVIGGKTLRLKTGLAYSFTNGKPALMFKGVTVMGVPLPNAWLGGIKNIDLLKQADQEAGFWKTLSDGVESLQIEDGRVTIYLKE
jgi:hypothetical protein